MKLTTKTVVQILSMILAALVGCSAVLHVQRAGETIDATINLKDTHTNAVNQLPAAQGQ